MYVIQEKAKFEKELAMEGQDRNHTSILSLSFGSSPRREKELIAQIAEKVSLDASVANLDSIDCSV